MASTLSRVLCAILISQLCLANANYENVQHNGAANIINDSKFMRRFTHGNSTYEISQIKVDWYLARIECSLRGMELVSIESRQEHEAILAEISAYEESFWTSGSDNGNTKNYFYWESTGHYYGPFYNWGSGQPDDGAALNLTDQNCIIMNSADQFLWYDVGCQSDVMRFICEKKEAAPKSSFTFRDKFYEISALRMDWYKAKYDCRSRGMDLVSIEDEYESEAIRQALRGAHNEEIYYWTSATEHYSETDFYWDSTGEYLGPFTDWNESNGQPNSTHPFSCVAIYSRNDTHHYWRNIDCWYMSRYVCERKLEIPNSTTTQESTKENAAIAIGKSKTFKVGNSIYDISSIKTYWILAKNECKLKGMELLSIESKEEQDGIANAIELYEEDFWTSGTDWSSPFIFIWDSTGQGFKAYSNWGLNEPDDGAALNITAQNHVILNHKDSFKWYDVRVAEDNLRFICEKKVSTQDETTRFTFRDSLYEVSALYLDWFRAARDCRSRGMKLVSIESEEEQMAIVEGLSAEFNGSHRFWTSGTDLGREGDFYWDSTGEFHGLYDNWLEGEPSNTENKQHCLCIFEADPRFWSDQDCLIHHRYICEKKL